MDIWVCNPATCEETKTCFVAPQNGGSDCEGIGDTRQCTDTNVCGTFLNIFFDTTKKVFLHPNE